MCDNCVCKSHGNESFLEDEKSSFERRLNNIIENDKDYISNLLLIKGEVKVFRMTEEAMMPTRGTEGSSGWDLHSIESVMIPAGKFVTIKTGLKMSCEKNVEIQIRPRSGLASKHGITVLNSPGTVDSDYRGEVKVILINHSDTDFQVMKWMKIAQMVPCYVSSNVKEVQNEVNLHEVSNMERGENGFGSTGL